MLSTASIGRIAAAPGEGATAVRHPVTCPRCETRVAQLATAHTEAKGEREASRAGALLQTYAWVGHAGTPGLTRPPIHTVFRCVNLFGCDFRTCELRTYGSWARGYAASLIFVAGATMAFDAKDWRSTPTSIARAIANDSAAPIQRQVDAGMVLYNDAAQSIDTLLNMLSRQQESSPHAAIWLNHLRRRLEQSSQPRGK
jgi:hypothetical protein